MNIIYDIETLANCFICCMYNVEMDKKKEFVIYEDQNAIEFVDWLKDQRRHTWVGYNNLAFDAQVIEFIYQNKHVNAFDIYKEAQRIIDLKDDTFDKDYSQKLIPEWKLSFKNRDLYKIKHYDSIAKRTSLKWLEFTFRMDNIEEMPIHHTTNITPFEIDTVVQYCWNDIHTTFETWKHFKFEIESRELISDMYHINVLNASEPRVVKKVYQKTLGDQLDYDYETWKYHQDKFKESFFFNFTINILCKIIIYVPYYYLRIFYNFSFNSRFFFYSFNHFI